MVVDGCYHRLRNTVYDAEVKELEMVINNLVVVSDIHSGCRLALCPPDGIRLDDGGYYKPSELQLKLWEYWEFFWNEWVPVVTKGEPYAIAFNGDATDGIHHNSVTQISHNMVDQVNLAEKILSPLIPKCKGLYYHLRGTEAHVGPSGQFEEELANRLKAVPNEQGQRARWELYIRVGLGLVHLSHHIGTTGSMAYETSGPQKELEQMFVAAARWGLEVPDVVVRSHRHRSVETRVRMKKGTRYGFATACTTAAWQLKTPFAYRIAGARRSLPQIGGTVVRCGDEDMFTRHYICSIEPSRTEVPELPDERL